MLHNLYWWSQIKRKIAFFIGKKESERKTDGLKSVSRRNTVPYLVIPFEGSLCVESLVRRIDWESTNEFLMPPFLRKIDWFTDWLTKSFTYRATSLSLADSSMWYLSRWQISHANIRVHCLQNYFPQNNASNFGI